jgi:predicted secreted protein
MLSFQQFLVALLAFPALAASASAQTPPPPSNATVLHLSETAERNVPRDRLRVRLAAEIADPDAAKVQAEINRRMTAALARIKGVPDIVAETNGYSVYQENPGKTPPRWHGSQSIALVAKDFAALLALVGTLQQDGLVITGLAPELSREARQSVEDELTDDALMRLQKRAEHIAVGLGAKVDLYRDLRIGNAATPQPLMRAMAEAGSLSQSSPPVAEPGEAVVSVTVQADIALAK